MSVIVLKGSAETWADAALEHVGDVEAYARRTLRNLDSPAYWTDRVRTRFLELAERKWEKGKDLRLSLRFLVGHAKRDAVRERTNRPLAQLVRDERERLDAVLDVRQAIARLDRIAQRILILLGEGYSWQEIVDLTGWSVWTISKVRGELARLLSDYQPRDSAHARRSRGRKRGTERPY